VIIEPADNRSKVLSLPSPLNPPNFCPLLASGEVAYFAGIPLVEIMEALGHTSEKQTIRYLGLTVVELAKMQVKAFNYLEQVRARMQGRAAEKTKETPQTETQHPVVRVST
jgi:hypothetical protein